MPAPDVTPAPIYQHKASWLARLWTLIRSSLVGLVATACDLTTTTVLHRVFGLSKRAANIPGLIPGALVMFIGNKYFAFQDRSKNIVKQGAVFFTIEAIALGLNALLYDRLVVWFDLHELLARLIGTNITYLGFSFPLWSILVFRRKAEAVPHWADSRSRG